MTYWNRSRVGHSPIGTNPIDIGEWLKEKSASEVVEDLSWLAEIIRTLETSVRRKGIQINPIPQIHRLMGPFEYEVFCFRGIGEPYRYWASRMELSWPRECSFDPDID